MDPRYTATYLSWFIKNIFYILIEQVDDGVLESMYYPAINYPSFLMFIFGGRSITTFFDSWIAFPNILSRGGSKSLGSVEFVIKFYYGPKGGAR